MLETRLIGSGPKEFHAKYPNAIIVESAPFCYGSGRVEMINWAKENMAEDALVTWEKPYNILIWYCADAADAVAFKLRWG